MTIPSQGKLPQPADPTWPRYAPLLTLPPYPFIPGRAPHPRRDPAGHSFGRPEPAPPHFPPDRWRDDEAYLFGVDLANRAYWWESHELWEALWHHVPPECTQAQFLQGLIQVSAANIGRFLGRPDGPRRLTGEAAGRLESVAARHDRYMGLELRPYIDAVRAFHLAGTSNRAPLIGLAP